MASDKQRQSKKNNKDKRNKDKKTKPNKHEQRTEQGNELLAVDKATANEKYSFDWFYPNFDQRDAIISVNDYTFNVITGDSGCGKSTTALWAALRILSKDSSKKLIFIKTPSEVGDDGIGYLSGSEDDKLVAHFATTKTIFYNFMTKGKLESDIKNDNIEMEIPNFLLGRTFDNAVVIIDEVQTMSPETVKLLLERCGKETQYIVLGDIGQRYSVKKRQDGLSDLLERCDKIGHDEMIGKINHIQLTTNERSSGSAFINKLYKE